MQKKVIAMNQQMIIYSIVQIQINIKMFILKHEDTENKQNSYSNCINSNCINSTIKHLQAMINKTKKFREKVDLSLNTLTVNQCRISFLQGSLKHQKMFFIIY